MKRDKKMTKGSSWFHSEPMNTEREDGNKDKNLGLHEINLRTVRVRRSRSSQRVPERVPIDSMLTTTVHRPHMKA